ncbi:sensor histidine kinase inhibitor, KipI family [Maribacter orientalis]|uniref:Sensor histidine kinase inhibitor, KipI family n=1 Tax=Maribacter orientalis TaxID=228957 RepID=A0A1H7T1I4_9FLAO|nr:5-oxoprolinase subunit PxpB [Maribacter orientalis]SEL78683.1 sensor histidine kinase inhibitor, KipI family [Maribacter orientalis]
MNSPAINIKPFGVHSVLIEWPHEVSEHILETIIGFQTYIRLNMFTEKDWEMVPSYNSLLLVNRKMTIDFEKISKDINVGYSKLKESEKPERYLWRLPVSYDLEFGLDLDEVAKKLNKSIPEIIAMHTGTTYTVYGIGFLPGFMYLGGLLKDLEVPRKATPRLKVVKGAVGIAGKQAGIYPQESPGGWNIIGNCSVPIFDASKENPCFVNVGDKIEFYQISRAEYDLHKIEAEVGIYKPEKIKLNA